MKPRFTLLSSLIAMGSVLISFSATAQDEVDDAFDDGRKGDAIGVNLHVDLASVIAGDFAVSVEKRVDDWAIEGGAGLLLGWRLHNPSFSYSGLTTETLDSMQGGYSLLVSLKRTTELGNNIFPQYGIFARQRVYNFASSTADQIGFSSFKVNEITFESGASFELGPRLMGTGTIGAGYVFGAAYDEGMAIPREQYSVDGIAYFLRVKLGYRF